MTKADFRHNLLLISLILAGTATSAQSTSELSGLWQQEDQSTTVRIARCSDNANLCATVIAEQLAPGETSMLNKIVARDIRPSGKQSWKGKYVVDGQSMAASAKLKGKDKMAFKVCAIAFLCETIKFNRISGRSG